MPMPHGMLRVLTLSLALPLAVEAFAAAPLNRWTTPAVRLELDGDGLRVITGKDYTPFFEGNFWGTEMPN
jgi:hypothetical protein